MTGSWKLLLAAASLAGVSWSMATPAVAQDPRVVSGGNADPACFAPWRESTRLLQFQARPGPYRVALANGYIANGWRRQMIRTAKAYASKPEVAARLREFRVVSTGEDVSAQVAAINGFIDAGFDAILVDAENPDAFGPVIERARRAGVILVAFDNTLDSDETINVNVDQKGLGRFSAEWIVRTVPNGGRILEVRGPAGLTVDRDRHDGVHEVLTASGRRWDVVEVNGMWDDRVAEAVTTEAIARHKRFDAVVSQAGDSGVIRALNATGHPFMPYAGENENGFRKACGRFGDQGLKCASGGTGPAQVAVALKAALAALDGKVVPQAIRLPLATVTWPNFEAGRDYYSGLPDDFFVGNAFPSCGIAFTPSEILGHGHADQ